MHFCATKNNEPPHPKKRKTAIGKSWIDVYIHIRKSKLNFLHNLLTLALPVVDPLDQGECVLRGRHQPRPPPPHAAEVEEVRVALLLAEEAPGVVVDGRVVGGGPAAVGDGGGVVGEALGAAEEAIRGGHPAREGQRGAKAGVLNGKNIFQKPL